MSIAIHGWSEARHDPEIRALIARFYLAFRDRLADAARHWQRTGRAASDADPQDVAQALMSQILGYVVQRSIVAGTEAAAIARGLAAIAGRPYSDRLLGHRAVGRAGGAPIRTGSRPRRCDAVRPRAGEHRTAPLDVAKQFGQEVDRRPDSRQAPGRGVIHQPDLR